MHVAGGPPPSPGAVWRVPVSPLRRGSRALARRLPLALAFRLAGVFLACVLTDASLAFAAPVDLGPLETQSVEAALTARGLQIDPAPEGKTVGTVFVTNQEVFSPRDSFFRLFNILHRTTREHFIGREILLYPGQVYDQALVDETMRNLRDPSLSSVVVVLPVRSTKPGQVDLLVVTRDVWSLRLNTDFEFFGGRLNYFTGSLSENNLLGWRKHAALVFVMDQGAMSLGPTFTDPNIVGTRLYLSASANAIFGRDSHAAEGSSSALSFGYPIFSLASRWGASANFAHYQGITRRFVGDNLETIDLKATPDQTEALPFMFRTRSVSGDASVTRQFGKSVIHRLRAGQALSVNRHSFTDDFPGDQTLRELFSAQVFPRSERVSSVFVSYTLFTPRYVTYRDFDTFDLPETVRLGPSFAGSASRAAEILGSERNFAGLGASGGWTFNLGSGLQRLWGGWSGRLQDRQLIDEVVSATLYLGGPVMARALRVVAEIGAATLIRDTRNQRFFVGGTGTLRGYALNEFRGTSDLVAHLELRSLSVTAASLRMGGLAFYDAGDAAASFQTLLLRQDVGLGLRVLIPQLNTYVLRVDWALPLQDGPLTRAGLPGRLSLGFRQAF